MNQRYSELDAIRGVAVIMVVVYHYSVRYGYPIEPVFSFGLGKYGVELFFIVSGFVIFLTLDKTTHALDFIVSRFSRLYPAYWIGVTLTFSVVYIYSLDGREVNFQSALINLT
jgi:peptidoglycan/LPS O-acetylase OafA/YrhL